VLFEQATQVPLVKKDPSEQTAQDGVLLKKDWLQLGSTKLL